MKPILILSLLFFIPHFSLNAQDGPNIVEEGTHIIPENPTTEDSIYLATWVVTANEGEYLGYQLHETDTLIIVEACYKVGLATHTDGYLDTINLGKKIAGKFKLKFIAYMNMSSADSCSSGDSKDSLTVEFIVQVANTVSKGEHKSSIACYPNPVSDHLLKVESDMPIYSITMVDMRGFIVYRRKNLIRRQVAIDIKGLPKGVYLLRVVTDKKTHFVEKIMHL